MIKRNYPPSNTSLSVEKCVTIINEKFTKPDGLDADSGLVSCDANCLAYGYQRFG
jgi:hypothetical protein